LAAAGSKPPRYTADDFVARARLIMIQFLIIACLVGIVASLGSGLFHLVKDKGESKRMVRALTVRVVLSVALFVLLIIAWSQGLIQPHHVGR
jgi:hypothetical protein